MLDMVLVTHDEGWTLLVRVLVTHDAGWILLDIVRLLILLDMV